MKINNYQDKLIKKINTFNLQKMFIILFLFFIISLLPRLSNLGRPLGDHHEWLTSTSLRTIQIWYEEGIIKHNFNPIMSFTNLADKFISNNSSLADNQGNFYYLSYPPFGYILPFFIFKAIDIYPTVLGIQIYNLFLHFISGFFIFLILQTLTNKNNLSSLAGYLLYIFSPATLWFQSNVYMTDMAVQPLFIIGLYIFLKIIKEQNIKPTRLYALGIINFLMIYTEWIGLFFALIIAIYCFLNWREKNIKLAFLIITLSSLISLALIVFQYEKISGWGDFINSCFFKYSSRSGFIQDSPGNIFYFYSWIRIIGHYLSLLGGTIIMFLVLLLRKTIIGDFKKSFTNIFSKRKELFFWILCLAPVLIHHLVFFNFTTIHNFSVLKTSIFLSLATGYLLNKIKLKNNQDKLIFLLFLIVIIGSVFIYRIVNDNNYSRYYKSIGQTIKETAKNNEVVFLSQPYVKPQIIIYARRNIVPFKNDELAMDFMESVNISRGIVFILNETEPSIKNTYYLNRD